MTHNKHNKGKLENIKKSVTFKCISCGDSGAYYVKYLRDKCVICGGKLIQLK